ncbi:MAG: hypothetical protein R3298_04505 [Gammaproteobacteria bacterium]|nr:hypothetical protein [Gammaproteobacteria bacterium]
MHKSILAAALTAAAFAVPSAALACSAAGPGTHIGSLTGADPANGTISIIDAESRQPITFSARPDLVDALVGKQGTVRIEYQGEGDELTATDVAR